MSFRSCAFRLRHDCTFSRSCCVRIEPCSSLLSCTLCTPSRVFLVLRVFAQFVICHRLKELLFVTSRHMLTFSRDAVVFRTTIIVLLSSVPPFTVTLSHTSFVFSSLQSIISHLRVINGSVTRTMRETEIVLRRRPFGRRCEVWSPYRRALWNSSRATTTVALLFEAAVRTNTILIHGSLAVDFVLRRYRYRCRLLSVRFRAGT